jgi:hypothetical protein
MQVFLRRTGLLELEDLGGVGGRDRRGDGALAAVVRAARGGESELRAVPQLLVTGEMILLCLV